MPSRPTKAKVTAQMLQLSTNFRMDRVVGFAFRGAKCLLKQTIINTLRYIESIVSL